MIFREAILSFLGVKTDKDIEDEYCRACKIAKKNVDCSTCDRKINIIKDEKVKTIGKERKV